MTIEPGRSWTDPLTNATVFAGLRLEDDLPKLLDWGAAPRAMAPAFLHEATHHWCFDSPVGYALALLHMRSRWTALRYSEGDGQHDGLDHSVAEDASRYETAAAFLRPLAEGMALFAEFDIVTRQESRVFSTPLEQATWFFVGPTLDPTDISADALVSALTAKVLQPMRLGQGLLARKVSLLGQPLTCDGDAYLPGYLLIRALWRTAAGRVRRLLNETDLFLMYLRSFLYDDLGLAAELLDTSKDEVRSADSVANRIAARLNEFQEIGEAEVASFEDALLTGGLTERAASVRVQPETHALGMKRLEDALRWYHEPGSERVALVARMHRRVLERRRLLYLGSWPADVEVIGTRFRVAGERGVVREGRAIDGVEDGHGPGSIDVVYWHEQHTRACVITRDGALVATQSFVPGEQDNDPAMLSVVSERDEARQLMTALETIMESVVEGSWIAVARRHVRGEVLRLLNQVYLPPALPRVSDDGLEATTKVLGERGFYRLLDRDRQLIEGFAKLGLACSVVFPHESMLRPLFEQQGLDLDRTIAAGNEIERRWGIGRVAVVDGYVLADV